MNHIDEYLDDQDFSPKTRSGYRRDLLNFYDYSGGELPTAENVKAWRDSLLGKGLSEKHVIRCLYTLKGYCQWMEIDIFAAPREKSRYKVRLPSMQFQELPETRSIEEVERLFKACRNPLETMLMNLLTTTGARIGELMKISTTDDLHWDNNSISLIRKGSRGRRQVIAVSEPVMESIKAYLDWRTSRSSLLLPFTYQDLRKKFKDLAQRAKVEFPPHSLFHNLRHFFVLYQKEAGTYMPMISLAVGHSSTHITERMYGAMSPESVKRQLHKLPWENGWGQEHLL